MGEGTETSRRGTMMLQIRDDELIQEMRKLAKQALASVARSEIQAEVAQAIKSIPRRAQEEYEKSYPGSNYQKQYTDLIYHSMLARVKSDPTWMADLSAEVTRRADSILDRERFETYIKNRLEDLMSSSYIELFKHIRNKQDELDAKIQKLDALVLDIELLKTKLDTAQEGKGN